MARRVRGWLMGAAVIVVMAGAGWQVLKQQESVAPMVSVPTLQGQTLSLAQWKGKVVLVNFWATSCSACVKEMPELVKTFNTYHSQGLETVAIAMNYDPPEYVENFSRARQLPFTVALDREGKAAKAFGEIRLTPTTFLLDKQGKMVQRYIGIPDFNQLNQLIDSKLKERA